MPVCNDNGAKLGSALVMGSEQEWGSPVHQTLTNLKDIKVERKEENDAQRLIHQDLCQSLFSLGRLVALTHPLAKFGEFVVPDMIEGTNVEECCERKGSHLIQIEPERLSFQGCLEELRENVAKGGNDSARYTFGDKWSFLTKTFVGFEEMECDPVD